MTIRHLAVALSTDTKGRPVMWKVEPTEFQDELSGLSNQRSFTSGLDYLAAKGWELLAVETEVGKKLRTTRATLRRDQ
jgi:hypothetical protein